MLKATFILREGFWNDGSKDTLQYPYPVGRKKAWKGRRVFLASLASIEIHWATVPRASSGHTTCRLCAARTGNSEYQTTVFGVTWAWPSGFKHYVEAHNLRPSLAFQEFMVAAASVLAQK